MARLLSWAAACCVGGLPWRGVVPSRVAREGNGIGTTRDGTTPPALFGKSGSASPLRSARLRHRPVLWLALGHPVQAHWCGGWGLVVLRGDFWAVLEDLVQRHAVASAQVVVVLEPVEEVVCLGASVVAA